MKGKGATENVERIQPWYEEDLTQIRGVWEELEVVEVEGEDFTQGVLEEGLEIQSYLDNLVAAQSEQ